MFEDKATEIIKFILSLGLKIDDKDILTLKNKIKLELEVAYIDGKISANRESLELVRELRTKLENNKKK